MRETKEGLGGVWEANVIRAKQLCLRGVNASAISE